MAQYKKYSDIESEKKQSYSSNSSIITSSSEEHHNSIIKNNYMVVVYYYADWCGPCKECSPKVNDLAEKYKNKVVFLKENVDEKIKKPDISGIPCFHFYINGEFLHNETITGSNIKGVENVIEKM